MRFNYFKIGGRKMYCGCQPIPVKKFGKKAKGARLCVCGKVVGPGMVARKGIQCFVFRPGGKAVKVPCPKRRQR